MEELEEVGGSGGFLQRHEGDLIAKVFDALEQSLQDYRRVALVKVVAAQIQNGVNP